MELIKELKDFGLYNVDVLPNYWYYDVKELTVNPSDGYLDKNGNYYNDNCYEVWTDGQEILMTDLKGTTRIIAPLTKESVEVIKQIIEYDRLKLWN